MNTIRDKNCILIKELENGIVTHSRDGGLVEADVAVEELDRTFK